VWRARALSAFRMIIVVGLGNPGRRYRGTRHNVGQEVVHRLAERLRCTLQAEGWARVGRGRLEGHTILLSIPETYMNVSGQAVRDLLRRRRRRPADLLVVHDDMDLPLGRVRLRPGDGAGGHNGVRSIMDEIGSGMFPRLRIGIGRPPAGVDPAAFVLERFSADERSAIDESVARSADAAIVAATEGLAAAMNRYNRRGISCGSGDSADSGPAGPSGDGPGPSGGGRLVRAP